MNERIKKVRLHSGLTQEEFANRIRVTKSSVSSLESGRNNPSDRTIELICSKFGINPIWLKTGEGDMTVPQPVADLAQEIRDLMKGEPPLASAVMASLAAMPREWWNAWAEKLYEEVERQKKRDNG